MNSYVTVALGASYAKEAYEFVYSARKCGWKCLITVATDCPDMFDDLECDVFHITEDLDKSWILHKSRFAFYVRDDYEGAVTLIDADCHVVGSEPVIEVEDTTAIYGRILWSAKSEGVHLPSYRRLSKSENYLDGCILYAPTRKVANRTSKLWSNGYLEILKHPITENQNSVDFESLRHAEAEITSLQLPNCWGRYPQPTIHHYYHNSRFQPTSLEREQYADKIEIYNINLKQISK